MIKTLVGGWANTSSGSLSFNTLWNTTKTGTSTTSQITVPTVSTGTYNCTVYWGDNTSNAITTYNDAAWTHTYPSPGTYSVRIVGTFTGISFNNGGDRLKLLAITNWGGFSFGSGVISVSAFYGCSNLVITATDIPSTTGSTSVSQWFRNCTSITTIPNMGAWDMSTVTNFTSVFIGSTLFNQDIGAWNVSAGTTGGNMFANCTSFNQNLNSWNVSNFTSLGTMFSGCTVFNGNITSWNTSKCTNFGSAFLNCPAFNQNISGWNTSKVTNMSSMFSGATSFNQNLGAWDITKLVSGSTGGTSMFAGVTLSNANYNGILAGWGAQVPLTGVTFSGGNSHYDSTSGGYNGTAGRAVLTGTYTWSISDGGTP
jgi:surface protein